MFQIILNIYNKSPLKNILKPIKDKIIFKFCKEFILKGLANEKMANVEIYKIQALLKLMRPIQSQFPLIRIGAENDGGYLIPDDFDGVKHCFSPGVGDQISFDLDLASRGIHIFLADGSVEKPPSEHQLISFEKKFIDVKNTDSSIRLDTWIDIKSPNEKDLILQMDIEGAEYRILKNLSNKYLSRFRIMAIEFHGLERLIYRHNFNYLDSVFKKILKFFDVVHIHPNNNEACVKWNGIEIPPVMEFTFLRKDRVKERQFTVKFPHDLDQKNVTSKRDIFLPEIFYK